MSRFKSTPCTRCGCCAEGQTTRHMANGQPVIEWDAPDPACPCDCHDAWRIVHHEPIPDRTQRAAA